MLTACLFFLCSSCGYFEDLEWEEILSESGVEAEPQLESPDAGSVGGEEYSFPIDPFPEIEVEDDAAAEESQVPVEEPAGQPGEQEDISEIEPCPPDMSRVDGYIAEGKQLIALTYDDGPHKQYTPQMLEVLRREDVRATFFLIGVNIDWAPEVVPLIARDGHQLGNHTMNHVRLSPLSARDISQELSPVNDKIWQMTGNWPSVFRPPYGDYNDEMKWDQGMSMVIWSIDTLDWEVKDAGIVYEHVIDKARDGSIVLMHDVYPTTVQATEWIIPKLKSAGFAFVTVEELIYAREGGLALGRSYAYIPPPVSE